MISFTTGDILKAPVEALVNPVNCVGVMGSGLAAAVKQAYPGMYETYRMDCKQGLLGPGRCYVYHTTSRPDSKPFWVFNFTTKNHWKQPSKLSWIVSGLEDLVYLVADERIKSLAIPALGCGRGGLQWSDVQPLIEDAYDSMNNVDLYVFEPQ